MVGRPLSGAAAVVQCVADIEVADFIALDLEFSGLFLDMEGAQWPLSLEEYFQKCVESIPHFLPLQLGVCCARKQSDSGRAWELRTHEFNLWPQDRRIFTADLQSLRFLRAHGFDFNTFFEQAYPYTRLPPLDDAAKKSQRIPDATQILAALRKVKAPLVFHNGLLDICHLYDKFIGDLPGTCEEFSKTWVANFPLIFDTRLIAQEGRYKILKHSGGLSLEALHRHLSGLPSIAVSFTRSGPIGADQPAHGSSGQDAALTAEVFLMEVDMWIRSDDPGESRKRPRLAEAQAQAAPVFNDGSGHSTGVTMADSTVADASNNANAENTKEGGDEWTVVSRKRPRVISQTGDTAGLASPSLLETHKVCRRFHNRITIMHASPGSLDLGRPVGIPLAP